MARFHAEFEELFNQVEGIPESMLIIFFVWGLKMQIRRELLLAPPKNLTDAMSKAQLFEERNNELRGIPTRERFQSEPELNKAYKPYTGAIVPITPSELIQRRRTNVEGLQPVPKIPIRQLTSAELRERREKGLCFSCDEKYHINHRCKNRLTH